MPLRGRAHDAGAACPGGHGAPRFPACAAAGAVGQALRMVTGSLVQRIVVAVVLVAVLGGVAAVLVDALAG